MKVPFVDLSCANSMVRGELDAAYQRVMDSSYFIDGPELAAFEKEFAEFCGVKYCVGVGNGLDAIRLLLIAYGIGPGDEVLVPSNTFIATWLAVTQSGATPVPVEPDLLSYNMDPGLLAAALTHKTRAIIPVHLYGQTADMDPIRLFAEAHGLVVIEDAAQAQGARYKGRLAGALGHAAATSFYPGKNLGAIGDAGAVLTSDPDIAQAVRALRNYGSKVKYDHEVLGVNSRLDELQAAFLRVKLSHLNAWNAERKIIAERYHEILKDVDVVLPFVPEFADPVWHLFVIRSSRRDEIVKLLSASDISTLIHYPIPAHKQKCYPEYNKHSLPICELLSKQVLSLPMYPGITSDQMDAIEYCFRKL